MMRRVAYELPIIFILDKNHRIPLDFLIRKKIFVFSPRSEQSFIYFFQERGQGVTMSEEEKIKSGVCPVCEAPIVFQEGCMNCAHCGWGACDGG